jgi:16S rRNA (cytosine967-C5)-methyltransferase
VSVQKPREIAIRVLEQRQKRREFTENLLEKELSAARLSSADRGLCQELVYGVVRWQATLDWLIARKTAGRQTKPRLYNLLRLGLYQIFWLDRIPDHAAVNETVELAKRGGFGAQAGFVNAVLRGYLREHDETKNLLAGLKTSKTPLGHSHPDWLYQRWKDRRGANQAAQLMEWNNTPPKTFARVNTLKTGAGRLAEQWREENVEYDLKTFDWTGENLIFELKEHPPLAKLESFQQGWFYLQDPSTLLAVHELDPQPGETILDLCAAPGGKTTFIAQLTRNEGRIVAMDNSADRLKLLHENCARLGATCVETINLKTQIPNGQSAIGNQQYDRVLVDAPCSNTGVMRRRVDLRWRIQPQEIQRLSAAQLDLLQQAASALKPGGALVYSTCSLEPEENSEVVKQFLSGHTEFKLEHERELLPFADGVDGAYVARLQKAATLSRPPG